MAGRTRVVIHAPVLGASAKKMAERAATRAAHRMEGYIRGAGRVDSGRMAQIEKRPRARGPLRYTFDVGTWIPYARYQNDGTRGHGPVVAQVLRFKPKGSNVFVFAPWVRGVTPARFAEKTRASITAADFR